MNAKRRTMRPRLARQVIAGISMLMLLLCQTAAAMLASTAKTVATGIPATAWNPAATAPCDHHLHQEEPPAHGCATRCPSRDASFETAKFNIPDASTVVKAMVDACPMVTGILAAPAHATIVATAAPPPLIITYCRLLI